MRLYYLQQFILNETGMQGYGFAPNQTVVIGGLFKSSGSLGDELVLDGAITSMVPNQPT
jgi:hypothetical protein